MRLRQASIDSLWVSWRGLEEGLPGICRGELNAKPNIVPASFQLISKFPAIGADFSKADILSIFKPSPDNIIDCSRESNLYQTC
jgi:hypothetical protein